MAEANSQKLENLLNLALEASPEERRDSPNLETGYQPDDDTWDLIIRYNGNLENEWVMTPLYGQYAIVQVKESEIKALASRPEIEYIEKPKRLFFSVNQGKAVSCVSAVREVPYGLSGKGILVAVIDSGVDYTHPDFRNPDGTTRILAYWDQTVEGRPPVGYRIGTEFTEEELNELLGEGQQSGEFRRKPSRDVSGHGTQVLGIAAGNGKASGGVYQGMAPKSPILVVKLGTPRPDGFPRTTELMQAVDYTVKKSLEWGIPAAINLSFGNNYGAHNGTSLLETYLDDVAGLGRISIVAGTGNEGNTASHTAGFLRENQTEEIEFSIGAYETSLNIQMWKAYEDQFAIELLSPGGESLGVLSSNPGAQRLQNGGTEILVYYGEPSPYSTSQEIYLEFLPAGEYLDEGLWKIRLVPEKLVTGVYDLWLPGGKSQNPQTRFYRPVPEKTLTIPSTARKLIAAGAYDSRRMSYAPFSGRGSILSKEHSTCIRPDLVAPGVGITTTDVGGGYRSVTGTSFAAPFVTGAAALLMEWGIVQGHDQYLYGEKVKAYLRKGARKLPGFTMWPNEQVGYGALCTAQSLPHM